MQQEDVDSFDYTWTSKATKKLFGIYDDDIEDKLEERIKKLNEATLPGNDIEKILTDRSEDAKELNLNQRKLLNITYKCQYLSLAYTVALCKLSCWGWG